MRSGSERDKQARTAEKIPTLHHPLVSNESPCALRDREICSCRSGLFQRAFAAFHPDASAVLDFAVEVNEIRPTLCSNKTLRPWHVVLEGKAETTFLFESSSCAKCESISSSLWSTGGVNIAQYGSSLLIVAYRLGIWVVRTGRGEIVR